MSFLFQIEVGSRSTQTINVFTAVEYSEPMTSEMLSKSESFLQKKLSDAAVESLLKAVSMTVVSLRQLHFDVWNTLWTTGFGISHSHADNAINGHQVNATMYYVLSQVNNIAKGRLNFAN